jgi:hypothetical protein
MVNYKRYISQINLTGLSETVFEECLADNIEENDEFEDEIIEQLGVPRKRKGSIEPLRTKKMAIENLKGEISPLEPLEIFDTSGKTETIRLDSFLLEQEEIRSQNQMIEKIKDYLKLEVLNLKATNFVEDNRAKFFQGFSEIAFSPESECDSLNSYQQYNDGGIGAINDTNSKESTGQQFFDMLSSFIS